MKDDWRYPNQSVWIVERVIFNTGVSNSEKTAECFMLTTVFGSKIAFTGEGAKELAIELLKCAMPVSPGGNCTIEQGEWKITRTVPPLEESK